MASPAQAIRSKLLNTFFSRYSIWFLCILIAIYLSWVILFQQSLLIYYFFSDTVLNVAWVISVLLSFVGLYDVVQSKHAILRNYPIMGHFRFFFESFRPEIRQYFIEADEDSLPFSRSQRSLVYQRAKNENADKPFGSTIDVYQEDYRFLTHSLTPLPPADFKTFRIQIGRGRSGCYYRT